LASGSSRFSVEMVVVSMPVTHENAPAKLTTALPSYGNTHTDTTLTRVYDDTGNVIETHEHAGDFKEW